MERRKELIQRNIDRFRDRLANACENAGRSADDVRVIAVTKYVDEYIAALLPECGLHDLGENRAQNLRSKATAIGDKARWHMIGHLQRNKARMVLESAHEIHSVDSVRLVRRLQLDAENLDTNVPVMLEVNVSGEESKYGFTADGVAKGVEAVLETAPRLHLTGLMTMAPYVSDPESVRPVFVKLRQLRDSLREKFMLSEKKFFRLSMGMSADFEVAVQEGATDVRVGSVLFEGLL